MYGRYERSFPNLKSRHSLDASDSFPIVCGPAKLAGPQTLSLHSSSRLVGRRRSAIGVERIYDALGRCLERIWLPLRIMGAFNILDYILSVIFLSYILVY